MTKTGEWNSSVRANPSRKSDVGDRLRPSCSRKAGDQEPGPCLACISHHPTVEAHDTTARTSLRLLAVLNVLFKYACARQGARASS
ncbi:MAG: hypothetical protein OXI93_06750 [Bryobacterales bacterium]|nr:hypothetical protein [Bryobacterales bacterium]